MNKMLAGVSNVANISNINNQHVTVANANLNFNKPGSNDSKIGSF